ncbi:type IV secretory system conjugative DNA transfer family protein [Agrobacterium tumefaciens]|uniref:type IV secretory system conjugative DNA transfer family protein n=1 Tax=Agrobacterium tumefaciens TaxID=358 RepID=UPI0021CF2EE7|nr:type IV secretory system conjugative DNA transfer family protein [Agrobacterium tumefaciens]UXS26940.1 type IV secretory system conjugative DNA transfer family protein [Agrobacterium tumefaciens]UXS54561.1 type IV secretory system conjugative DNA transfer family protein [Agrobacterium tumefaciens]UXS65466.1 type IV secretory system conjugative DNA transfer family protein [Agrobacterium tumefaciens]
MDVLKGILWLMSLLLRFAWWAFTFTITLPIRLLLATTRRRKAYGSARWANRWEQWRHKAIRGEGIVLGRGAFRRLLRFSTDGIVMVFAATGAGKGLGVVIPTLLTYRGSMVVSDPKGENYAITRRRRAEYGKVWMLNPSDLVHSERFNPMDTIRAGTPQEADDAESLARLMVVPDARESHWDDKAVSLIKALILHTLHEPVESRCLGTVRRLTTGQRETFLAMLTDIATSSPSPAAREIVNGILTSAIAPEGDLSSEFRSILSNVQKATEPWSSSSPAGKLSAYSTFQLTDMINEVGTLYLCVDEDLLDVYSRWLRVMVGCTLKTLTRAKTNKPKRKVVLLLDEVAVLGRLDVLEKQSGLLRAYCTPVLIWQNLPQVTKIYGDDAKAFLANASARLFFGVGDNDTAEYVATMLGKTPAISGSSSISLSSLGMEKASRSRSQSESNYWLLDSAEIQRLPVTKIILKLRDCPFPILGKRLDYRKTWRWKGIWDRWNGIPKKFDNQPQLPTQLRQHPPLEEHTTSFTNTSMD